MEETKTPADKSSPAKPLIHRVCEACNCMFTAEAGSADRRCPNCRKD